MALDPTTPLGKVRLRVGDWADIPILPDIVITTTLTDCQNNVPRAASLCAQYILATLTAKTHKKLAQVEMWSSEQFSNYVKFLQMTVLNPHLSATSPVPYVGDRDQEHPILTFLREQEENLEAATAPNSVTLIPEPVVLSDKEAFT